LLENPPAFKEPFTEISQQEATKVIAGWWCTYPSEKYESQMGLLFPIYIYNIYIYYI